MILDILACLLLAVVAYAVKRFFDDRKEAREVLTGLSRTLEQRLEKCIDATGDTTGLVRERLSVFEKALANAIVQLAEIVKETRVSELDHRAKTAGQLLRQGRRPPTP